MEICNKYYKQDANEVHLVTLSCTALCWVTLINLYWYSSEDSEWLSWRWPEWKKRWRICSSNFLAHLLCHVGDNFTELHCMHSDELEMPKLMFTSGRKSSEWLRVSAQRPNESGAEAKWRRKCCILSQTSNMKFLLILYKYRQDGVWPCCLLIFVVQSFAETQTFLDLD